MAPGVVLVVGDFALYPDILQLPVIKKAFDDTADLPTVSGASGRTGNFFGSCVSEGSVR